MLLSQLMYNICESTNVYYVWDVTEPTNAYSEEDFTEPQMYDMC